MFFDYFKTGLNWIFVSKEGPVSALVKGASLSLDAARDAVIWLRNQFNPGTTTDNDSIIAFAKSRGITRLPNEPYDYYLARVINAFMWYRRGGSEQGMAEVMRLCGYDSTRVINYRDIDLDRWAEFIVDVSPAVGDVLTRAAALPGMVEIVKPARSKCAGVKVAVTPWAGRLRLGAASASGHVVTIGPPAPKQVLMSAITQDNNINITLMIGIANGHVINIDWGDGSIMAYPDVFGEVNHTYADPGERSINISGDTDHVLAFGLTDCTDIYFDWDIAAFSAIRFVIANGLPQNAALDLAKLKGHSTLQGVIADGSVKGDIGDLPLSSLYHIAFTGIDPNITGDFSDLSFGQFISTGWLEETFDIENVGVTISFSDPCYSLTGDIAPVFKPGLKYLYLFNFPASYTSCQMPLGVSDGYYNVRSTAITPEDSDQLIADFNTAIQDGASGTLRLHNITPASQSDRNELSAKGFAVIFDEEV